MVTHEPDIAAYTKRNIVMRDGVIVTDKVAHRADSELEGGTARASMKSTPPRSSSPS